MSRRIRHQQIPQRNAHTAGLLRRDQVSPAKLKKIWTLYEKIFSENDDLAHKYFGKRPYEFLTDQLIFARNFGEYGETIRDPGSVLANLPPNVRFLLSEDDIGKYLDSHAREYFQGYQTNSGDYFVRLPRAKTTEQSYVSFPDVGDVFDIYRRNVRKTIRVTELIEVRKATAWLKATTISTNISPE